MGRAWDCGFIRRSGRCGSGPAGDHIAGRAGQQQRLDGGHGQDDGQRHEGHPERGLGVRPEAEVAVRKIAEAIKAKHPAAAKAALERLSQKS